MSKREELVLFYRTPKTNTSDTTCKCIFKYLQGCMPSSHNLQFSVQFGVPTPSILPEENGVAQKLLVRLQLGKHLREEHSPVQTWAQMPSFMEPELLLGPLRYACNLPSVTFWRFMVTFLVITVVWGVTNLKHLACFWVLIHGYQFNTHFWNNKYDLGLLDY